MKRKTNGSITTYVSIFGFAFFLSLTMVVPVDPVDAGLAIIPLEPKESIPRSNPSQRQFETWSLFLICNPSWLRLEKRETIKDLHQQFLAFGDAIGPSHAALWFGRDRTQAAADAVPTIDSSRSALWCEKFGLLPSQAPYVFVTSTYPDLETPLEDFEYYFLSFHRSDSCAISHALAELTDQLLVTGLSQEKLESKNYWLGWKQTLTQFLSQVAWKASVGFNTKFFKGELTGQGSGVLSGC